MKIRRFYGNNIRSALRQVTEEFGNDAAILSNKKVAGGVEVIAALDYDDSLVPSRLPEESKEDIASTDTNQTQNETRPENNPETNIEQLEAAVPEQPRPTKETKVIDSDKDFGQVLNGELSQKNEERLRAESPQHILAEPATTKVEWSLDPSLQAMKEELGLMRSMMSEQLKGISWNKFSEQNPLSAMIIRKLSQLGLDADLLNSIMPQIVQQSDAECAWQQVLAILAKLIPMAGDDLVESGGVVALMGLTGVGKTTTIAKLAARHVIKHGVDSVALISTDNYRISSQEQLATFGRILQIPTAVVSEKNNLASLIKKFSSKRLILIDTAGISLNDNHLAKQLEQLQRCGTSVRKLLSLSASAQGRVMQQAINYFNRFGVDGVIVTKLDETASLGELLSVVIKSQKPVVYTTDGQRIPEDIRIARSHHLVSKAVWLASKYPSASDDWELAQTIDQVKSA